MALSRSSYNEFQASTAQSKGVMKSSILVEKYIFKNMPISRQSPSVGAPITSFRHLRLILRDIFSSNLSLGLSRRTFLYALFMKRDGEELTGDLGLWASTV